MDKRHIQNYVLNVLCGFKLIAALLLTALMAVGNVTAQVKVKGNVYGGGNLANVGGSVTVNIEAGQIGDSQIDDNHGNVYGGGAKANTNTDNWVNDALTNDPYYAVTITEETDLTGYYTRSGNSAPYTYTPASGSASSGTYYKKRYTEVNLTGGIVKRDVYGGGLGYDDEDDTKDVPAMVYSDVAVTVDGSTIEGSVFGANNIKGTPKGHVKVLVLQTKAVEGHAADVADVFGGGNKAAYEPANTDDYAEVEISKGENPRLVVDYVYGGGNEAGIGNSTVTAGTLVNIVKGDIISGVYGGCNTSGTVTADVNVDIKSGTIGISWETVPATFPQVVFGGGLGKETLVSGSVTVNIGAKSSEETPVYSGDAVIWGDVYGGSAKGNVNAYIDTSDGDKLKQTTGTETKVNLYGGEIKGNLYGGGLGDLASLGGDHEDIAANVYGPVTVTVQTGKATNVFGCNNENGAPQNSVTVNINGTDKVTPPMNYAIGNVYGGGNQAAYTYTGSPLHVNINGGTVDNVFGGGLSADVAGSIAVTVTGGTVYDDVYGGGALANTNTVYWDGNKDAVKYEIVSGLSVDEVNPDNSSSVTGYYDYNSTTHTYALTSDTKAQKDKTYFNAVTVKGNWVDGQTSASASTTVTLTGGTVGNVYGGGLGYIDSSDPTKNVAAMVYGDVTVTVNKADFTGTAKFITLSETHQYEKTYKDASNVEQTETVTGTAYKKGRVFGANNINGTPKGNVTVTVWSTTPVEGTEHKFEKYEIQAVYGGGNLADYDPVGGKETNVNIHGCDKTSIQYVFGGGNAAKVPDTHVDVYGTFEIEAVFGGGNGNEPVYSYTESKWVQNPGAEISSDTYVTLRAGLMHQAFGGSFEKGVIHGTTHLEKAGTGGEGCELKITDIFGGGKDADVTNVNIILSECNMGEIEGVDAGDTTQKIENVYAGSYNARIFGDVTMTVRSGNYKNVFGGNYSGGFINGAITINIEETENCKPITIGNLYGGGNYAPYPGLGANNANPKITINVKACTSIGNVFGASYHADVEGDTEVNINMIKGWWAGKYYPQNVSDGNGGTVPNTNVNDKIPDAIGTIGNVYGGGDEGRVIGNTVVNIGNLTEISLVTSPDVEEEGGSRPGHMNTGTDGKGPYTVLGANITGNVFGGGRLADVGRYHLVTNADGTTTEVFDGTDSDGMSDVRGNSSVNICAVETESGWESVPVGASGVAIGGNVYGGGEGSGNTFRCEKAMVTGSTTVRIYNGTVKGTVYGGGMIGRVEQNTEVTIGFGEGEASEEDADSKPEIKGNVFGAGAGVNKNGYSALVRGTSTVTVQGNAKVRQNVYGGGEVASVGRYKVVNGLPESLADPTSTTSGYCYVNVLGYAEIGPATAMNMRHVEIAVGEDKPDDYGHVFGAGKGTLPYEGYAENDAPQHMTQYNTLESYSAAQEEDYFKFVQTLALATQGNVVIGGHAFVKGSVYGGSENGYVQHNTYVTIQDHCQIGCGEGENAPYAEENFIDPTTATATEIEAKAAIMPECAHWPYGKGTGDAKYAPYDPYYGTPNYDSKGGRSVGDDGHTFYGNVFGGGSGYFPYKPGKWFFQAGQVKGNTTITITGGHILTNVYGGNEMTNVGEEKSTTTGTCTINFGGTATLGVPRTLDQIKEHPVTCYLFGGGKGDQRVLFNKQTNVNRVVVNITGGLIYGSVFGGGEDGHVMGDVDMNISGSPKIGTWGTSYVDGNIFGGGRGFGGDAYTAGNVGGSVDIDIDGGTMLGSIYGGGRLGSVGYGLYDVGVSGYGEIRDEDKFDDGTDGSSFFTHGRGHVNIDISGTTVIGNPYEYKYIAEGTTIDETYKTNNHIPQTEFEGVRLTHTKGGNVFAGGMGRRTKLDNTTPITIDNDGIDWHKLGNVKSTKLTISGDTWIKGNVYGGGEFGAVTGSHTTDSKEYGTEINITGGTIGTVMGSDINNTEGTATSKDVGSGDSRYSFGSVYGGGYGTEADVMSTPYETNVEKFGAWIGNNTYINIRGSGTKVRGSVYGGGEMACVKGNTDVNVSNGEIGIGEVRAADSSDPNGPKKDYVLFGSWRMGNVYGAGKGSANAVSSGLVKGNTTVNIGPDATALSDGQGRPKVFHNVYGGGAYGSVGTYTLYSQSEHSEFTPEGRPKTCTSGGTATVTITGGQIGINGWDNGMVCGSGRGDVSAAGGSDPYDRLAWVNNSIVTIGNSGSETSFDAPQPQIKGSLYGGGENGHNFGDTKVDFYSGTVGTDASKSYDNGNVYGSGCGTDKYTGNDSKKHHNRNAGFVNGSTTVNIHGGYVKSSVYGGGSMASVGSANTDKAALNISGGTIDGSVYGGAKGDLDDEELKAHAKASWVTISGSADIKGSVYGGGMAGVVEGDVKVYMTGGNIAHDLYGGGALAHTNTKNVTGYADTDAHDKEYTTIDLVSNGTATTYVRLTGGTIGGNAYGGALGRAAKAAVVADPANGIEAQDAVTPIEARAFGNVKVNLNGMEASEYAALSNTEKATYDNHASSGIEYASVKTRTSGCIVNRVFGANNINGTPKGSVVVNVFATQNNDALKTNIEDKFAKLDANLTIYTEESQVSDVKEILNNHLTAAAEFTSRSLLTTEQQAKVDAAQAVYSNSSATLAETKSAVTDLVEILNTFRYDVDAVYGGGNEAAYAPASSVNHSPSVNIYNCELTSIETVYGGGNAARVPETHVTIYGAYEIYNVFGGGNGKDALASGAENPGADVTHNANTKLRGGRIHEAYGSSNTKGVIGGEIYLEASDDGECRLNMDKMVGAGKNADIERDVNLVTGCSSGAETLIGGADNANVKGNINLMITSGHYTQVFGGNNRSGIVMGHIKVNVEETDCNPITIDELYGCGNEAPYSKYGYYVVKDNSNNPILEDGHLIFQPRSKEDYDNSKNSAYAGTKYFAVKDFSGTTYHEYTETEAEGDQFTPYEDPVINIISCTYIGKVFGGGLGERAVVHGSPTVNINMIKGGHANLTATFPVAYKSKIDNGEIPNLTYLNDVEDNDHNRIGISCKIADALGKVHDVFGAGNEAHVYGNTTVNIGNAEKVQMTTKLRDDENKPKPLAEQPEENVLGANIIGNVYGGGNLADVGETHTETKNGATSDVIDLTANTFVNIGAEKGAEIVEGGIQTGRYNYTLVDLKTSAGVNYQGVTIGGNVFGGGKGEDAATMLFRCDKAMVTGSTNVCIGNGTVGTLDGSGNLVAGTGNVYGGGEVGRVEVNGSVTIGTTSETSDPIIRGSVFGAGKGLNTHGYSALMRGNSYVTIQGDATVGLSVYGGGEVASVGRYFVAQTAAEAEENGVEIGMPYSEANNTSGKCIVTVRGNAKIGPDDMTMPTFSGNVFGAGKGVLPYEGYRTGEAHAGDTPWRMHPKNEPEEYGDGKETDYLKYIQTLGLASQTEVTIEGKAFVKGSVYGGSQNGIVQHDTHVTIQGDCQIGNGDGVNARYLDTDWAGTTTPTGGWKECASWTYGKATGSGKYAPYDKYAGDYTTNASTTGDDGHTYYGNVFGGGSGVEPYEAGKWHNKAGHVGGNTLVDITGGHILTCVFGGNEMTSVDGTSTVNFGGTATLGVPRTLTQIKGHPVTCYLFGAGKGDPRAIFDSYTNVSGAIVNVSGGKIYGSIFGGAEDGHVLGDVTMTVSGGTIGTWGTSYVDGNVFGGGRGYSGQNIYAGVITGNVGITISDGTMLGSVYGGGRLGSVGINASGVMLDDEDEVLYVDGDQIPDDKQIGEVKIPAKPHGYVTVNITGGTIGNDHEFKYVPTDESNLDSWKTTNNVSETEYETTTKTSNSVITYTHRLKHTKGGNVFAGGMGRRKKLDTVTDITNWTKLGNAKSTKLTISGADTWIMGNVYGGGEFGAVTGSHTSAESRTVGTEIIVTGGTIGTEITETTPQRATVTDANTVKYTFGSIYGGGMGSEDHDANDNHGGSVTSNTSVSISGANTKVRASVYGGGEMAVVDESTYVTISGGEIGRNEVKPADDSDAGYVMFGGATMGNVYGGGKGHVDHTLAGLVKGDTHVTISDGNIYHNVYGGGALGSVGTFTLADKVAYIPDGVPLTPWTSGGTAYVTITGGTIGISGRDNGMVNGSSRGNVAKPVATTMGNPSTNIYKDPYDKVAWIKESVVTIGTSSSNTGPTIKGSVYGGGENGHNAGDAHVTVYSGTIGIADTSDPWYTFNDPAIAEKALVTRGNVYGAGCGTDTYTGDDNKEHNNSWAGLVAGNTDVAVHGGRVTNNVYGGGSMGSVGTIISDLDGTSMQHNTASENGTLYGFGLSWPLEITFADNTGKAKVTIDGTAQIDNYVFGAARGNVDFGESDITKQRYEEAKFSNVRVTNVVIGTENQTDHRKPTIRTVYGGGEDGHVMEDAIITIHGGTIARTVFGGGKGTSTFKSTLWDADNAGNNKKDPSDSSKDLVEDVHSWTAGKVYGNTNVTINNGNVGWFVYGGGNMASVGKGNYSGGSDDYSLAGYGELPSADGAIWTANPAAGTYPSYFQNSGTATVNILGGTVGTTNGSLVGNTYESYDDDGVPYGSVFGGSRGMAAASCSLSPRYRYVPDFFLGYVNKTIINIGGTSPTHLSEKSPKIYGSVYGGSQDGHVRNSTEVKIYKGEIKGQEGDTQGRSGHVFGAGSGIGKVDGKVNNSSGSVTCTTLVEMTGGEIAGNVYGGGAMASVGPPKPSEQEYEQKEVLTNSNHKSCSHTLVNIIDGEIEGNVYGASRGPGDGFYETNFGTTNPYNSEMYATDIWSDVNIIGGNIAGSVYGGGEGGVVKQNTKVKLAGGTIEHDAYGGGKGTKYVEANVNGTTTVELNNILGENVGEGDYSYPTGCVVNRIFGANDFKGTPKGHVKVHVFATQRRDASDVADKFPLRDQQENETLGAYLSRLIDIAKPGGTLRTGVTAATINSAETTLAKTTTDATDGSLSAELKAEIEAAIAAVKQELDNLDEVYDVAAVYGGGNLAPYIPASEDGNYKNTIENTEVIIDGCSLSSIRQVYGGGNAAPAPATSVTVNACYEIDEVFGGGNGKDDYQLDGAWYENPGANVGYETYSTHSTTGASDNDNPYKPATYYKTIENPDASTKEMRQEYYSYGKGEAKTEIYGGRIHKAYGGSNEKGNISSMVLSKYDESTDCPVRVDETYGGGKNSIVDGDIDIDLGCVEYMEELFGGSKNADVNSNICLNVTNGTYGKVFGGNNTSGAIAGTITVNVKEQGCTPIIIGELYAAGYLAPYSVYGYEQDGRGGYRQDEGHTYEGVEDIIYQRIPFTKDSWQTYLDTDVSNAISTSLTTLGLASTATDEEIETAIATAIAGSDSGKKTAALQLKSIRNLIASYPKADPRINIISATRIGNIFGGGYQALVVGNPHVNVNMEKGKIAADYMAPEGSVALGNNTDAQGNAYRVEAKDAAGNGILPIGTIGNIYGGGNQADISGDTYVEIGTGKWLKAGTNNVWETEDASGVVYTYNGNKWQYETKTTEITGEPTPELNSTMRGTASGVDGTQTFTYKKLTEEAAPQWTYNNGETEVAVTPDIVEGSTIIGTASGVDGTQTFTYHAGTGKWTYEAADAHIVAIDGTPTPSRNAAEIDGNVYGGGKGVADHFVCDKAMVNGENGTSVVIANGTVKRTLDNEGNVIGGNVYGGGEIGRVENNTEVTVGLDGVTGNATFKPVVEGNVFGAGKGKNTHGYSALVRGTSTVNIQGDAKVGQSVYGGGEIASVGRYKVGASGLPEVVNYAQNPHTGYCFVTVKDNAEIGPDDMVMNKVNADGTHKVDAKGDPLPPDDTGYVFGAGKGVLPYEGYADDEEPYHMNGTQHKDAQGNWDGITWDDDPRHYPAYNNSDKNNENPNPAYYNEADYFKFVRSMALATQTEVRIEDNAFIKGGVYGGAENGFVQQNTHVVIEGNCQIGNGFVQMYDSGENDGKYLPAANMVSVNRRYTAKEWEAGHLFVENDPDIDSTDPTEVALRNAVGTNNYKHSLPECASWPYGIDTNSDGKNDVFAPYDKYALTTNGHEEEYAEAYDSEGNKSTNGGRRWGSDGHTFYGNVFGGGSGYFPYRPGKWFEFAGAVHGNTLVEVKGGHILTSLYGGNEMTDVGNYEISASGDVNYIDGGTSYVTMTGGTLGVPRTLKQIAAHPVTCYLFGAGKGDQRIFFNESTNVGNAVIHVSDNARIYGSVFGGGEDGHVMENVKLSIGSSTLPTLPTGITSAYSNEEAAALTGSKPGTMKVTTASVSGTETTETMNINYPLIGTTGTSYVDGNVFGAGRGFSGDALTAGSVGGNVEVNIEGGTMLGSIYGGGRLASVGIPFTYATNSDYGSFKEDTKAKDAVLYTEDDAEVIAGTKQVGDVKTPAQIAKSYGHVTVNISGGTIGNPYEDIYLDGADKIEADEWTAEQWKAWKAANKVSNTEFEVTENAYRATHTKGGNVFGGSMGRLDKLDGSINRDWWPQLGQVKTTTVNISGNNTLIKSCVYGGGELGVVRDNTTVVLGKKSKDDTGSLTKPTIIRDLYGGGYGSKDYADASAGYVDSEITSGNTTVHHIYRYTPLMWAGMVGKGTELNIYDGWVKRNVYGGGEMASVGIINYEIEKVTGSTTTAADLTDTQYETGETWKYKYITKHHDETSSFALSWPYKTEYVGGYTGATYINIYGGRLGVSDDYNIWADNGDIYGGSKGMAGDRYVMAFCGNVGSSNILIDYPSENGATLTNYLDNANGSYTHDCIVGAVYGGGEDGHVMGDTYVTLKNGLIGHAMYGGGSGKGKYEHDMKIFVSPGTAKKQTYSFTAGKVYGDTHVRMEGGYVGRFVYGGGNMGSVGKGNYACGTDDYYPDGYGEKINTPLWPVGEEGEQGYDPGNTDFLNSGKTEVEIFGGTIGYVNTTNPSESMKDGLPYGSVFGGSRGESAPNIEVLPSDLYKYSPEFFSGYVNETKVTIGGYRCKEDNDSYKKGDWLTAAEFNAEFQSGNSKWELIGPTIKGSVFGGGQDGHVRRDTHVIVDAGEIGMAYNTENRKIVGTLSSAPTEEEIKSLADLDDPQWLHRGNVYGAGSGIGKYIFDFDNDKETYTDKNNNDKYDEGDEVDTYTDNDGNKYKDIDYSTSAGSVTGNTQVDINGGTIHRNVYGGGSLASVGPPAIQLDRKEAAYKPGTTKRDAAYAADAYETIGAGWWSMNTVNVKGTVGTSTDYQAHYGGEVYGACRGDLSIGEDFGISVWTKVLIKDGANILGNVFGGGDNGKVKRDTDVQIGEPATP